MKAADFGSVRVSRPAGSSRHALRGWLWAGFGLRRTVAAGRSRTTPYSILVARGAMAGLGANEQLIRELIATLGASIVNTNNAMQQFGNNIQQALAGRDADGGAAGYRVLKPKKDVTKITAASARVLMVELAQFEVDLGELGITAANEAAYRQLRAVCEGKARDILDLELVSGAGAAILVHLNQLSAMNADRNLRNATGGQLYLQCHAALGQRCS